MISHEKLTNEMTIPRDLFATLRRHWLSAGMQTVLDFAILSSAFAAAYLFRFDFDLPLIEKRNLLIQIPFVVILQFAVLSATGARAAIWRYTGMGHIKPFFYAALGSLFVVTIMRFELPESYQAWRVPLSVNFVDCMLAFGGTFGLRVLRRGVYEQSKRRQQLKSNGNGNNDEESDARRWARSEKGSRLWRVLRCKARMMSSGG